MNTPVLTQSEEARAPWNDRTVEPIDFSVRVTETLTRRCDIKTSDYTIDSETMGVDTSSTDWRSAYMEDQPTVLELLHELQKRLEVEQYGNERMKGRKDVRIDMLISACKGWTLDDMEVTED